jgi:hypothetical protein
MHPDGPFDRALDGFLDDLERQAEGLHLADRAVEVAELRIAQYAEIELAARLHASAGRRVRVSTVDGWSFQGDLICAGTDWIVVDEGPRSWAVTMSSLVTVSGLGDAMLPTDARPISARLGVGSVLRRRAETGESGAIRVAGGRILQGSVTRVGSDFLELDLESREATVVPFRALVAVELRSGVPS